MAREEEEREGNRKGGGRTNDVRTPGTWARTYGLFRGEEKDVPTRYPFDIC